MSNAEKTFDIDSTYRNRQNYPNPYDFVVPYKFKQDISTTSFLDPVLESSPYTGSTTLLPGDLVTGLSANAQNITLDPQDVDIVNYYINSKLQLGNETRNITYYDGFTKIATVDFPFSTTPSAGTVYFIRKISQYFSSDVGLYSVDAATNTVSQLNLLSVDASITNNFYDGSYIRYTNGPHKTQTALITNYSLDDLSPWSQSVNDGNVVYLSGAVERGVLFTQTMSGILNKITLTVTSFETVSPGRTLVVRIRNGTGLNGTVVYTDTLVIPNNAVVPSDIVFSIISGPTLTPGTYTLTLTDTTINGDVTGYIGVYGIAPTDTFITLNFDVYPRLIINSYMLLPIVVYSQPATFTPPLLDGITTGVSGCYSVRLLKSSYSGPCVRVRRSSDNTERNIGFVMGAIDLDTLKLFVGSGSGFVSIFYDQNSANNLTQTTPAFQPRIVNNGLIDNTGGVVAITFDGIDDYFNVSSYPFSSSSSASVSVVSKIKDKTVGSRIFDLGNNIFATNDASTIGGGGVFSINNGGGAQTTTYTSTTDTSTHSYTFNHTGSVLNVYKDGNIIGNTAGITAIPSASSGPINYIGKSQLSNPNISALFQEIIFFTSVLPVSVISGISANQRSFYSTP